MLMTVHDGEDDDNIEVMLRAFCRFAQTVDSHDKMNKISEINLLFCLDFGSRTTLDYLNLAFSVILFISSL